MPELQPASRAGIHRAHARTVEQVVEELETSSHGLNRGEAARRLERFGSNTLPRGRTPGPARIFLHQFLSPLIYVLLAAAVVSLVIKEWSDAAFIFVVLLLNAAIGAYQEYTAQQAALALQRLVTFTTRVEREGDAYEIDAREVVPGDVVLLEAGAKVPADLRLWASHDLQIDESLLTGESAAVAKDPAATVAGDSIVGDRTNMAFAGTLVTRGRGRGVVVATGLATELGRIAEAVVAGPVAKPPLMARMERFTFRIALAVGGAVTLMALASLAGGAPLQEVFLLAVALAVAAIPEGLPVALTVALAVGMQRMARRNVIVRRLVAVEALGSCTFIASDKTGTLTLNELTATRVQFAGAPSWRVSGEGTLPEGTFTTAVGAPSAQEHRLLQRLCRVAVLANEAFLGRRDGQWAHHGDAVDVALLVMAHKAGVTQADTCAAAPELAALPFESQSRFAATLNDVGGRRIAFVKGAPETVLPMCGRAATAQGDRSLDSAAVSADALALAESGFRLLALAEGEVEIGPAGGLAREHLRGLTLVGLVGMIDPLRPEVPPALDQCRRAGIEVSMVTGDHPVTALAIAREIGLAHEMAQVVTGAQLAEAALAGDAAVDTLTARARVFARVEPQQKLDIVRSLQRNGHFVAVTGDGANDAPALRAAEVGVAMGRKGTDVARESADLIVTDDNFASIAAGIEEGRIAYGNVRKVIFLLVSTGAAEIVLFALTLLAGLPLPLVAVQLLWLNLVTNGIQDVALAFEPAEGNELLRSPRPPKETVFNRLMLERVVLSAVVIGGLAFAALHWLLTHGYSEAEARNGVLLLMVLFENIQALNSRSETRSVFRHNPLRNRLLLFGVVAAQLIHIGAMYTPGLRDVLEIKPVTPEHWLMLLALAALMLVVMEFHKWLRFARRSTKSDRHGGHGNSNTEHTK